MSCPDIEDRVLIISDPMIATGSSLVKSIQFLKDEGNIKELHIVCAIACTVGIEYVLRAQPKATIWCGDIDDEITAKGYIVPGLGDAGDLAFGVKKVESLTPIIIKLPSSPNLSKKALYSTFAMLSSGNIFASVNVK